MSPLAKLRHWTADRAFKTAFKRYFNAEDKAQRRGDTQAIHRAREAKTKAVHDALKGAR